VMTKLSTSFHLGKNVRSFYAKRNSEKYRLIGGHVLGWPSYVSKECEFMHTDIHYPTKQLFSAIFSSASIFKVLFFKVGEDVV